ncbi:MAG: hypothetical protein QOG49_1599 [Frankiaceae bacterium]|nr:hypothetical protein [Frankiaceae bacterium]
MLLDVVLVLIAVGVGFIGYRQGFVTGVLNVVGLVLGSVAGMQLAPAVARSVASGPREALVGMGVVLAASTIGQLAGTAIGSAIRGRLLWRPLRRVDSVGGALVSVAGVLVISWLVATQVKDSSFTSLARQVTRSRILRTVDAVMPPAPDVSAPFRRLITRGGFPQVFAQLKSGGARPVAVPDPAVAGSRAVVASRRSIVRVTGLADKCSQRVEGSGFVYADDYVMTNAHVVAGVRDSRVTAESGQAKKATVVLFDPERDIAILHVEHLGLPPLDFAGTARSGDSAVVAGFPEDGPFNAVPARVRDELTALGRDIYERSNVRRQVYAVRAKVLPGNSGGPLLATDGRVYGVVFASAADDPDTGYALTAGEVSSAATLGRRRTQPVATGACA